MITTNDIITLPISNNSLSSGLDYALISWACTFNRMGTNNLYRRLEKILIGVASESELIALLKSQNTSYNLLGRTRWYEHDRYDISINGTAVDLKTNFLDTSNVHILKKYNSLNSTKEDWFLNCTALVPKDQFLSKAKHKVDINYIFSFAEGKFNENNLCSPLVHAFWDYRWLKKAQCRNDFSTEQLDIFYDAPSDDVSIKIFGSSSRNVSCIEEIMLNRCHVKTKNAFHQVFSVLWTGMHIPSSKLVITKSQSNLREEIDCTTGFDTIRNGNLFTISMNNWQSLKLYQPQIHFLGWINIQDLQVIGQTYPRFTHTIEQYAETEVANIGCPVRELSSLSCLI